MPVIEQVSFRPVYVVGRPWDAFDPMATPDVLHLWTIFRSPKDAPGRFVVRRFEIGRGNLEAVPKEGVITLSLAEARALVPLGLFRQDRSPNDEPAIVESWF